MTSACTSAVLEPAPEVCTAERATSRIFLENYDGPPIELSYTTSRIVATTMKGWLATGDRVWFVGGASLNRQRRRSCSSRC